MLLSLLDDSSDRLFIFFRFLNSSKHLHKQIQSFHSRVLNSQPHRRRRRHSSFTVIVYNSLKFNKTLQKNVRIDSLGINYYYGRTHNNQRDKILDVYPKTGNWPEMRRPRYIYIYIYVSMALVTTWERDTFLTVFRFHRGEKWIAWTRNVYF